MTNKEEELHITENTEKEDLKEEPQAEPDLVEGFPPELLEGLPPEIKKNIQVGMSMHRVAHNFFISMSSTSGGL
ncbi:MAG: hypothetical protein B6240_06340 [Desulfobacteraceae bacterium 4572_87]|nr:MAG: hypothetical protein B6240_06340 [Desulfobacteraceae bacterium 4572_87]